MQFVVWAAGVIGIIAFQLLLNTVGLTGVKQLAAAISGNVLICLMLTGYLYKHALQERQEIEAGRRQDGTASKESPVQGFAESDDVKYNVIRAVAV